MSKPITLSTTVARRTGGASIKRRMIAGATCWVALAAVCAGQVANEPGNDAPATSLEETRLAMGKWIETQQIIARERQDWQQGKEILAGRLELVKREIAGLEEKIAQAQSSVAESNAKRDALVAENEQLKATGAMLTEEARKLEVEVRRLYKSVPDPVRDKLTPLYQRIPDETTATRVSVAERFQNVLGILNELNKAHSEITVSYEVHNLANGKPAEVRAIYVGLASAYYVSAGGEAGIGSPTAEGWTWQPSKAVANDILKALEILQGTQTPAFVPLPVKIQ